jgi:Delta7-sterol 5-desaturase
LVVWNEAHFYVCHRALHLPALRRFHLPHHRSIVTTPWATYAFHPIEALMLGSVLLIPMLLHDFSFAALIATPLFSLLFNNIGHSNYDFLPGAAKDRWWLNGARRHHQHHVSYHGNYGFMFPFIDRWLGTALPIDKAHA